MGRIGQLDRRLFARVAAAHPPGVQHVLPRLSRTANHGALWFATAAGLASVGGRSGRRAALRGLAALTIASATTNTVIKYLARRQRPLIDAVPVARRLARQPVSGSFPSGHAASAAAFATGVALESGRLGAAVAPVAAGVAASRVYVGVHYPSDVLTGCLLGAGAGLATARLWPRRPPRRRLVQNRAPAPALRDGDGLVVVINDQAGPGSGEADVDRLTAVLPDAEVILCREGDDLEALLDKAVTRAASRGGALGVCGGDGTLNAAAARAAAHGVPLAVFPGGTLNHFALDAGIQTFEDTAAAVRDGQAIAVGLARARPLTDGDGRARDLDGGDDDLVFLNTFSVGLYPELVQVRESLEDRVGKWPAVAVALARVLRTAQPWEVELNGDHHRLWLLFVGNGLYSPEGFAPAHRTHLDDGLLDVRAVTADRRLARTRVVIAALTGTLPRSRAYSAARVSRLRLRLSDLGEGDALSYDGEAAPAPEELLLDARPGALTVYHPASESEQATGDDTVGDRATTGRVPRPWRRAGA